MATTPKESKKETLAQESTNNDTVRYRVYKAQNNTSIEPASAVHVEKKVFIKYSLSVDKVLSQIEKITKENVIEKVKLKPNDAIIEICSSNKLGSPSK